MTSKPLVSLLMTLVIIIQLVQTDGLSTESSQAEQSNTTKKSESSYLYVLGGKSPQRDDASMINFVSRLSSATGEWKTMKSLPTNRTEFCGAVVGKKIYLFGGYTITDEHEYYVNHRYRMASNDVYDCLTDTYTELPPMPDFQRSFCGATVLGESIYVSGGVNSGNDHNPGGNYKLTNSLFRFDTRTNQWSTLSPMNKERQGHKLIELGGLLYAIGGAGVYMDGDISMEVYNPTTDKWTSSLVKTNYRIDSFGSATAHEGKIYAYARAGFQVYSPGADRWTTLSWPIYPRNPEEGFNWLWNRKLVSLNGKLWVVGGDYSIGVGTKAFETLHSYDPATNKWTTELKIDLKRRMGHSAFVVNL